jgi:hypothetical protein
MQQQLLFRPDPESSDSACPVCGGATAAIRRSYDHCPDCDIDIEIGPAKKKAPRPRATAEGAKTITNFEQPPSAKKGGVSRA